MKKLFFSLTLLIFLNFPSFAVDPSFFVSGESAGLQSAAPIITFGYIMQLLFSLLIVLGFIYVASKYLLPKLKTSTKGNYITVVDKIILEPQVSSYIIKVKESAWLIVVSNKHVAKIDKLEGNF